MKKLSRQANLITPNLTEACLLSDTPFEDVFCLSSKEELLEKVSQIASKLHSYATNAQDVIITGVKVQEANGWNVYNVALTQNGISLSLLNGLIRAFLEPAIYFPQPCADFV